MYDVIVVGAGWAGSAAAKRCAENGLKTLILEKLKLPREKMCGGLISPFGEVLVKREFGDIPDAILCNPPKTEGHYFHMVGISDYKFRAPHKLAWRRKLDYWMNQKAQAKGAELRDDTRVLSFHRSENGMVVEIEEDGERTELATKFIVGADGANSTIRKYLFPNFKMNYLHAYQEHFPRQVLDLDREYSSHMFCYIKPGMVSEQVAFVGIQYKDDTMLLHFTDKPGRINQLVDIGKQMLAENYHFDAKLEPMFKEACLVPLIHIELVAHTFKPAKGNVLLVGDAGGLNMPLTSEGISPSMKSGAAAANAIMKAVETGKPADSFYLPELEGVISRIKVLNGVQENMKKAVASGKSMTEVFKDSVGDALEEF